ncbi:hypothetical protein L198_03479 [Cryptococcus wingfieldii CBS 7118]|uniref:GATA-type domain-containing protein n=1 Tax=Cryptococcus wingfieldii CBS 7118 TaxID=1295528 RepID=A0A1E3JBL0_9TREE|nr:hypothetical protein L198_03479 [Cryptococcus wingfieldii CBS 7118]ODN98237.1 hypothetical protein L198_03479 [Cryptococcus wingfieldii CBS 7118]
MSVARIPPPPSFSLYHLASSASPPSPLPPLTPPAPDIPISSHYSLMSGQDIATNGLGERNAGYTYRQTPSLSSERSTVSPSQIASQGQQQFWKTQLTKQYSPTLPQIQSPAGAPPIHSPTHHPHAMMLPPLRLTTQDPRPDPRLDHRLDPRLSATAPLEPGTPRPHASPISQGPGMGYYPYPMSYPPHRYYPPHQVHGHPGMPPNSASSAGTPEIFTPVSGHSDYSFYPPPQQQQMQATIQPSVFSPWQAQQQHAQSGGQDRRGPPGTLSFNISSSSEDRVRESPGSSANGTGGGGDGRWENKSPMRENGRGSPASSEDEVPRQITYTTDAEIKQCATIKRECFNCTSRNPPSWRKSLCNKCGIFERTHHRPRPPQNDDQKLRKASEIPNPLFGGANAGGYGGGRNGRAAPPPALQTMSMSSGSGSPRSPFSGTQSTPMSASFTYPPMYTPAPQSSSSEYPPSSSYLRRPASTQPQLPNLSIPSPPFASPIISNDTTSAGGGGGESGANRYYGHTHSASSPYAHAYASRRGYAPPSRGSISSTSISGGGAGSVLGSPIGSYASPISGPGQVQGQGGDGWHSRRLSGGGTEGGMGH